MQRLTGDLFRAMISVAADRLEENKARVNALNVFPVPDGDTGSNMALTMQAAAVEIRKEKSTSLSQVAEAAASGALMGARGNSGVILSQFFRGFADGCRDSDAAGPVGFARALRASAAKAYEAVMEPTEGTMLTVGRWAADAAESVSGQGGTLSETVRAALEGARKALEHTPNLLPVLKEAGVVDAGGEGWVVAFEAAVEVLIDGRQPMMDHRQEARTHHIPPVDLGGWNPHQHHGIRLEDVTFKYCTEFLIRGDRVPLDAIKEGLEPLGDSLLVVGNPTMAKIHIHSNHPGQVLEICGQHGDLLSISIGNMEEQNRAAANGKAGPISQKQSGIGVVAVCSGPGLASIFESLGVDRVVQGGQTMNPSIEELRSACMEVGTPEVVVLPNNKNVVLTARQIDSLVEKDVRVVETTTVPQGIAAMMGFDPEGKLSDNVESMTSAVGAVVTGEVTYAVRSTTADGLQIREGDIIGLMEGRIICSKAHINGAVRAVVKEMASDDVELVTLYSGADVPEESAEKLLMELKDVYPDLDIEHYRGDQPLYYYIVSAE